MRLNNNNFPLLKYVASKKKPLILSTGMSNLSEILEAFRVLKLIIKKKFLFYNAHRHIHAMLKI